MSTRPLTVTPTSSAPSEDILNNIRTNMKIIDEWFKKCHFNDQKNIHIVSAGPSTKKFLENYEKTDVPIICVKHSLPLFKRYNIIPEFCSVLDPRSIHNVSTLGKKRKDLFATADKKTTFFVASMTHPSVTEYLLESGYKVVGYHTMTGELQLLNEEEKKQIDNFIITGGTCSATRAIEISFYLGFTSPTLVGFDSSFDGPRPTDIVDAKGRQMYMKVTVGGKPFWTTGELIAQSQDLERLFTNPRSFSQMTLEPGLDSSLVDAIVKEVSNKTKSDENWRKYLA